MNLKGALSGLINLATSGRRAWLQRSVAVPSRKEGIWAGIRAFGPGAEVLSCEGPGLLTSPALSVGHLTEGAAQGRWRVVI